MSARDWFNCGIGGTVAYATCGTLQLAGVHDFIPLLIFSVGAALAASRLLMRWL